MQEHYSKQKCLTIFQELLNWLEKQRYSSSVVKKALPKTYQELVRIFTDLEKLYKDNRLEEFAKNVQLIKQLYSKACFVIDYALNQTKKDQIQTRKNSDPGWLF